MIKIIGASDCASPISQVKTRGEQFLAWNMNPIEFIQWMNRTIYSLIMHLGTQIGMRIK